MDAKTARELVAAYNAEREEREKRRAQERREAIAERDLMYCQYLMPPILAGIERAAKSGYCRMQSARHPYLSQAYALKGALEALGFTVYYPPHDEIGYMLTVTW